MLSTARSSLPLVVHQHVQDATMLRTTRSVLVRAPHVKLHLLQRLDDRLAAALDGVAVAGDDGRDLLRAALETPDRGAVFAATVNAVEGRDFVLLEKMIALAEVAPEAGVGLVSAFGWVQAASLRGVTSPLLASLNPFHRRLGLAACAMHQVDPGSALDAALQDPGCRMSAAVAAGKLGRQDLLAACLAGMSHADNRHPFESARASLLLGDRREAVHKLGEIARLTGPHQVDALTLLLKVLSAEKAAALLGALVQDAGAIRLLIRGAAASGDPRYVPWLIAYMRDPMLARLAGEAFGTVTGLDLASTQLAGESPGSVESGPTDSPHDIDVSMDDDDSLPWPDADKVLAWWEANAHSFEPGTRYFAGHVPSYAHCLAVLKTGLQRQRIAAAEYLCILQPGTKLFPTSAPAWRQQRWLDAMDA